MKTSMRIAIFLFLSCVLLAACLFLGAFGFGLPHPGTATGHAILMMRVNRIITGFFVGAALACAGVVFQALLRNPLAEPYILGVSSGAGLGAAIAILTGFALQSFFGLPAIAFGAALLTLGIVFALAGNHGSPSVYSLILSGVIVSSICSSLLMFIVSMAPVEGLHSVIWWMLGNLEPTSRQLLIVSATLITAGCAVAWAMSRELDALTLGRETAHNIGIRTTFTVITGLLIATLITATAVGLAGLIGFVGLIVPHVARNLVGPKHRYLIPVAAIGGGVFLAVCDAFARFVLSPQELPVGVVTALVGGPFFLFVLRRKRMSGWTE